MGSVRGTTHALNLRVLSLTPQTPRVATARLRAGALFAALAGLIAVLLALFRPWYTTWGATEEERRATLPGDAFILHAPRETRAISIGAPADRAFAWVSQLGQDRAGFYSYELLEDLAGCEMPNLQELAPTLQRWAPGDKLWMYPPDKLGGMGYATLREYQPDRALVFETRTPLDGPEAPPSGTWSFIVKPTGQQSSRLLVRGIGTPPPNLLGVAFNRAVFEPMHFAMERRMMEGIRAFAEGKPIPRARDNVMLASWVLTFGSFCAAAVLVLMGASWQRRLIAFILAGGLFQILTLLQPSPLLGVPLVVGLLLFTCKPAFGSSDSAQKLVEQTS
jgi:hypothetical protein